MLLLWYCKGSLEHLCTEVSLKPFGDLCPKLSTENTTLGCSSHTNSSGIASSLSAALLCLKLLAFPWQQDAQGSACAKLWFADSCTGNFLSCSFGQLFAEVNNTWLLHQPPAMPPSEHLCPIPVLWRSSLRVSCLNKLWASRCCLPRSQQAVLHTPVHTSFPLHPQ